jgi:hypothetical protein
MTRVLYDPAAFVLKHNASGRSAQLGRYPVR